MRQAIPGKTVTRILRWGQFLFFAAGASMLAYCGFALVDARNFQQQARHQLDWLAANPQAAPQTTPVILRETSTPGLIGRIEIPRLGISAIVIEGTGPTTLRRAVGHIPGTSLPGKPGNIGVSGHRDTFFRPLRNIRKNDDICLVTPLGEFRYRVVSTRIVSPEDVAVLDPTADEVLTLVTCYPFYFVGSAPERFIVRATRVI